MMFRLVYKSVENVIYLLPDVRPETQKFAVDSVKRCFQKVSLSRILGIEKFEKLQHKFVIDVALRYSGLEILGFQ